MSYDSQPAAIRVYKKFRCMGSDMRRKRISDGKKSFDGKNPYRFLCAAFNYLIRPKETYAGKRVVYRKKTVNEYITAVRRDIYVPD